MHPRGITPLIHAALADTPVILLHGARQTGKSTLARAVARPPRRYLTLDDGPVLAAALSDPGGFIAGLTQPVILDEVQRAPALLPAIKAAVDHDRRPGRFLLTGSANILFLPRISESLAGRMQIITLWPLSQGEIAGRTDRFIDAAFAKRLPHLPPEPRNQPSLIDRLIRGGFPEPLSRRADERRSAWFDSYTTAILQRDIRSIAAIDGLTELPRLLRLLAARTAGLLNFADLSRGLSIPQSTLKRYFALLQTTFLATLVPPWSANLNLRLTKSPKLYLPDSGLACYLLGLTRARLAADSMALGPILENFVVAELLKQATWSPVRPAVHHFRTVNGREVDAVLEDGSGRIVGVEVKASASVDDGDFSGLKALAQAAGDRFHRGIILYTGPEPVPFRADLHALPISALWRLSTSSPAGSP